MFSSAFEDMVRLNPTRSAKVARYASRDGLFHTKEALWAGVPGFLRESVCCDRRANLNRGWITCRDSGHGVIVLAIETTSFCGYFFVLCPSLSRVRVHSSGLCANFGSLRRRGAQNTRCYTAALAYNEGQPCTDALVRSHWRAPRRGDVYRVAAFFVGCQAGVPSSH